MGNIGGGEILVVFLVALIFLGPEKLPEVARQIGKVMGEVRKISTGFQREIQDAMRVIDEPAPTTPAIDGTSTPEPASTSDLPVDQDDSEELAAAAELPVGAAETTLDAAPPIDDAVAFEDVATPPEAPPLPTDVAHGGDR